jgi:hypothetical protein
VTLQICIPEISDSNPSRLTGYPDLAFHGFSHTLQANATELCGGELNIWSSRIRILVWRSTILTKVSRNPYGNLSTQPQNRPRPINSTLITINNSRTFYR